MKAILFLINGVHNRPQRRSFNPARPGNNDSVNPWFLEPPFFNAKGTGSTDGGSRDGEGPYSREIVRAAHGNSY
jgi:hypothetical protein